MMVQNVGKFRQHVFKESLISVNGHCSNVFGGNKYNQFTNVDPRNIQLALNLIIIAGLSDVVQCLSWIHINSS